MFKLRVQSSSKMSIGATRSEPDRRWTAMLFMRAQIVAVLIALAAICFFNGCADVREGFTAEAQRLPELFGGATISEGYWRGDNVRGPSKIVVHVGEQRAYFYKGRNLVGESTVSTGKRGFDTPPGHYRVIQKDKDHISSEFGDYITTSGEVVKSNIDVRKDPQPPGTHFDGARMPYFMRFNGGYGMHAGYVPRFRASHGCIRLPTRMARHFFENAPENTPVIVRAD
jgi:L,D-transpeptidase catalytic domain